MGLLRKLFGTGDKDGAGPLSSQFHESEPSSGESQSRNAPRRELVHGFPRVRVTYNVTLGDAPQRVTLLVGP